jgi:group I intron endonuclease
MGYIYKITNIKNNKCYIGVTTQKNPNDRWNAHKSSIRNCRGCPLLMKAFNKYGELSFIFEVIIICFDEDVFHYEDEYIKKYNSASPHGYNVAEGGMFGMSFLGKTHSEETKKKISIKSKEYNNKPEVKERSRNVAIQFNKTHNIGDLLRKSEKWKKAVEEGRIGATRDESKKKISDGLKKYFENNNGSPINKEKHSKIMTTINGRKVHQYSNENQWIATFDSILLAGKATNINRSSITQVLSEKSKTAGGFIWKYADPPENKTIRKCSDEVKDKIRKKQIEFHIKNAKQVEQYSHDNKLIAVFDSITLAIHGSVMNRGPIMRNLSGKTKTAYGFIWKYRV